MNFKLRVIFVALAALSGLTLRAQTLPDPLLQAVRKAVQTNPDVQARWHGLRAALSEQEAMRGGLFPRIDLSGSVGRESRQAPEGDRGKYNSRASELTLIWIVKKRV